VPAAYPDQTAPHGTAMCVDPERVVDANYSPMPRTF